MSLLQVLCFYFCQLAFDVQVVDGKVDEVQEILISLGHHDAKIKFRVGEGNVHL